jgi:hypothetical protein
LYNFKTRAATILHDRSVFSEITIGAVHPPATES